MLLVVGCHSAFTDDRYMLGRIYREATFMSSEPDLLSAQSKNI